MEPLLGSYNNRVHNFLIDFDSLVNMYIPCFPQVFFPYFENNKKWKEGKSPKRKIKGLRKEKIKKNKKWTPKEKIDKNKTWKWASQNATTINFYYKDNDYV